MKLINKKTGEIGYLVASKGIDQLYVCNEDWHDCSKYNSVTDLNKDWEDYEESKKFWYIFAGHVFEEKCDNGLEMMLKATGNYFKTKKEAQKGLEKSKAWKRLGAEIVGWAFSYDLDLDKCNFNDEDIVVGIKLQRNTSKKDLDLLFGGEDE